MISLKWAGIAAPKLKKGTCDNKTVGKEKLSELRRKSPGRKVHKTSQLPMKHYEKSGFRLNPLFVNIFLTFCITRDLVDKIEAELPVLIRHLLNRFASHTEVKKLLHEQQRSDEALAIKHGTDPIIDLCAALYFMEKAEGLMMGRKLY
ncbi:MAG: hypothetical protein ABN478_06635 [Mixta sp.]